MYQVTIAMPLYNAEIYLMDTLSAALNQSFKDIEFLIIDDRGTDNSINIIHRLQQEHPRGADIRIVSHSQNLGVAEARNTAIREALGKYLFYLDSDDLITPDCIELLYRAIEKEQTEVSIASHRQVSTDTGQEKSYQLPSLSGRKADELAALRFGSLHHVMGFFVWNILYKLSFLKENNLRFKPMHIGEDFIFMYDLLPMVRSFVLLPDITYTYIRRPNSLSQHGKRKTIPLTEIKEQIFIRTYGKQRFLELTNKPYADNMVDNLMKYSFEAASYVIANRHLISPPISAKEVKELLRHPLKLREIGRMKQHRGTSYLYFLGSKLPYWLMVPLLIGFMQLLKLSWRIKAMRYSPKQTTEV